MTMQILEQTESRDGTLKVLWRLTDGQTIESVLLPRSLKQRKKLALWQEGQSLSDQATLRFTACVSSQVGCAMACDFCLTGKQGYLRNLSAEEIITQVRRLNEMKPVTNVVFMGMGEPLQNIASVTTAIQELKKDPKLKLSRRRITVSTSGVLHSLPELAKTRVRLAISLNATTDDLRTKIMPINKRYPIASLIKAAKTYASEVKQTVMVEYILLAGLNDSLADAERLRDLCTGWDCKVNLIPYNTFAGVSYERPDPLAVKAFQNVLVSKGITATVRYSGGDDILAACGQLRSESTIR